MFSYLHLLEIFLQPKNLAIVREMDHQESVYSLWLDHGQQPELASYPRSMNSHCVASPATPYSLQTLTMLVPTQQALLCSECPEQEASSGNSMCSKCCVHGHPMKQHKSVSDPEVMGELVAWRGGDSASVLSFCITHGSVLLEWLYPYLSAPVLSSSSLPCSLLSCPTV